MKGIQSQKSRWSRLHKIWTGGQTAATVLLGRRFLEDFPDFGPVWTIVGDALLSLARYDEAEQAFTRAIDESDGGTRRIAFVNMGHLFEKKRDYGKAAQWYKRAIQCAPEHANAYIYLGGLLAIQGHIVEAEQTHRNGILCSKGYVCEAHFNLGLVLRAQYRYEEAAKYFRKAMHLEPDYEEAKLALKDVKLCLKLSPKSRLTV